MVAVENQTRDMNANIGSGLPGQSKVTTFPVTNEYNVCKVINDTTLNTLLFFRGCKDCEYTIDNYTTKIMVQECNNLKIHVKGKIMTSVIEIWKCDTVDIDIHTKTLTLQLDLSSNINIVYDTKEHYQALIWAGCENVQLGFNDYKVEDADDGLFKTGLVQMRELFPSVLDDVDQFIVRFIKGKLRLERVVRLQNGYPTTEREAREFDQRQEEALRKLAEQSGIKIKPKPTKTVGRNDPCICGSVRKYKKCCGAV
ncbi:hypothetical protein ROZALSC1DRAFT_30581 [Rozella allomycis CSF55]|uniref:Adenylate cyclase-associated CAP C-terminal domain-containing protein n=1 Tax=Rozella allomycis (strain CSF55) TaxID=988480 RepID=A0A075APA8_ROZAC|nr:hypothetical protein O9G_004722 [Rozella allomycis CSF55]RKP17644.1 hypothetical protein ROZALSC1DRAFT_30581 [Rozella allomycis CSF55]|eukprot:EPZ31899.1 hypothetical protein O9G_004722 [Rozella allomycis CSF55]